MATEFAEVETRDVFVFLTFRLEDGDILQIEEQTSLTEEDLIRFAHYDLRIYSRYRVRIHTVVLSPAYSKRDLSINDTGCLHYPVTHPVILGGNADEVLERIPDEWWYGGLHTMSFLGHCIA